MAEVARRKPVILSGAAASQREAAAQSKDPYELYGCASEICREKRLNIPATAKLVGSFDCTGPFASEWAASAQDDNWFRSWGLAPRKVIAPRTC